MKPERKKALAGIRKERDIAQKMRDEAWDAEGKSRAALVVICRALGLDWDHASYERIIAEVERLAKRQPPLPPYSWPFSFSRSSGKPGHGTIAQVWDAYGKSIVELGIGPKHDAMAEWIASLTGGVEAKP